MCTRTSVMRPVSKHKRVTQYVGYNRSCHNTSKSLPRIVCRCNTMYKTTNTFNDKPLHLHVMSCCKQAWGRKMNKKKSNKNRNGFKQWYYREIVTIDLSKRGFVFLQITLFVFPLLLEVFRRCVFPQVYKLAPLFIKSIMNWAGYLFSQKRYIRE